MILKNIGSQGTYLFAVDTTASPPNGKTGDAANITGFYSLDGAAQVSGFTTANPTEIGHGVYWQPLTQGETNGNAISYGWSSSTTGIVIEPVFVLTSGINIPSVAPGAANGILIAGSNAPTSITGTSNSAGLTLTGQGTGPGILSTGGATGHAFALIGGATSGDGINIATTSGHGINAAPGGATKHGMLLTGSANTTGGVCDGAHLVGGFEGIGLHAIGGAIAASGAEGAKFEAASSNSNGLTILGFGTGHGLSATSGSGATGDGFQAHSVSTAGSGVSMTGPLVGLAITSSSGPGINIAAGTHGILSNAGNNGDGFSGIGAGSGAGFRAAGHDGIVGTGTANGAIFQSTFAGQGMFIEGTGAFPGLYVQGGGNGIQIQATGTAHHGLVIAGGDVTGDGINISTTSGDAIRLYSPIGHALSAVTDTNDTICILANSGRGIRLGASGDGIVIAAANGHGISSTGGTNGDGFHGVGTGTGVGFRSTADAIGFGGGTIVIKKNTALAAFMFYMALASDNKSPALGLTITSTVALDGAAFGATANSAVEMTGGWYKIDLAAADLNGDTVALEFTGPGANSTLFSIATQS